MKLIVLDRLTALKEISTHRKVLEVIAILISNLISTCTVCMIHFLFIFYYILLGSSDGYTEGSVNGGP